MCEGIYGYFLRCIVCTYKSTPSSGLIGAKYAGGQIVQPYSSFVSCGTVFSSSLTRQEL